MENKEALEQLQILKGLYEFVKEDVDMSVPIQALEIGIQAVKNQERITEQLRKYTILCERAKKAGIFDSTHATILRVLRKCEEGE